MIYAYDNWVQMPTVDLYDTLMMLAAVLAAKDMYEKGEQRIKDFNEKYGDFMTPIKADQDWYNQNFGGKMRDYINNLYAKGGDPLRNAQDRASMMMMVNSLPYGEYAFKKQRAENAKEWYKNMGILNANGKYNKDFSEYLKETPDLWALDYAGTTSPTEFLTLKAATNDWYKTRTARSATPEELKQMGLDSRYDWKLFTDDDLMNIARDQTPGWRGSAVANYYRDLAEKQVAASGLPYTQADVEKQLQRNIASAQQGWLIKPIKGEADKFDVLDQSFRNQMALQNDAQAFQREMADKAYKRAMDVQRLKNQGKGNIPGLNGVFKYGEATQDQAIMSLVDALVGTMEEPIIDPKTGKPTGKTRKVTVNDADRDTVLKAYRSKVLIPYRKFMRNLWNNNISKTATKHNSGDPDKGVFGNNAFSAYLNRFGYIDSNTGFESSMGKKINQNGLVPYTSGDFENIYTDAELLAMADGYKGMANNWTHKDEIERVLKNRKSLGFSNVDMNQLMGESATGVMEGMVGSKKNPNKVPIIMPDGSMIMFRAVNIKYGNKNYHNTGRLWIPVGSPTLPKDYTKTKNGLRIGGLNPYTAERQAMLQIEETAKYLQALGSLKNQNVGLPSDYEMDPMYYQEVLKELLDIEE